MSRSQRHAVYIKGTDAAGKGVAEGVAARVYVQQFIASQAFAVPLGPPSGPLKGSSLAGYPPTALPAPKGVLEDLSEGGELTDPGQFNLSGNPHYIDLPPAGEGNTEPPDGGGGADPLPVVSSLDPDTAVLGSADVTMHVHGSGFTEGSTIYFADQPEPIVFVSDTDISTVVKPTLGWGAVTVQVYVQSPDGQKSAELPFTFTEAGREAQAGDRKFPIGPLALVRVAAASGMWCRPRTASCSSLPTTLPSRRLATRRPTAISRSTSSTTPITAPAS